MAQNDSTQQKIETYIDKFKDIAIREMLQSGIPASITLGQGILESDAGTSKLSLGSNNHFGIKCHLDWNGETFIHDDDEKNECFRKYPSIEDSYVDHSLFLLSRNWYKPLFELKATDYKGWAKGLKAAGYATDKNYAEKLIGIIEKNELMTFDKVLKSSNKASDISADNTSVVDKPIVKSIEIVNSNLHEIQANNDRLYIIAKKGDNLSKLAKEFEMREWQLYKYNDLAKGAILQIGEIVYLQPKRNQANKDYHIVRHGEDMRSISQIYCIKLNKLYENNLMTQGSQPKKGEKIYLRKRKV